MCDYTHKASTKALENRLKSTCRALQPISLRNRYLILIVNEKGEKAKGRESVVRVVES